MKIRQHRASPSQKTIPSFWSGLANSVLKGLIGKRSGSRYDAGKRTGAWVKIKLHQEQEFVIGGYTGPEGSRKYFGALLVGFYEGKKLKFAGRVGTGFSDKLLRSLYFELEKIRVDTCPFFNLPATGRSRWDQGLAAAEMKRCHWVKPSLACQVKFTEWTRDDRLRQAVFLGIREDKNADSREGKLHWFAVRGAGVIDRVSEILCIRNTLSGNCCLRLLHYP